MPSLRALAVASLALLVLSACPGGKDGPGGKPRVSGQALQQPRVADPLAALSTRYPVQHYLAARGDGPTGEAAGDAARQNLLAQIRTQLSEVQVAPTPCEGADCPQDFGRRLVSEVPPFKHGALIQVAPPVQHEGRWLALATLRRDKAAPYLEEDIKAARQKLEAWRRLMRAALAGGGAAGKVLQHCQEPAGAMLRALEGQRLALAVIVSNAGEYRASDDLKSVLDLQVEARKLLASMPTTIVVDAGTKDKDDLQVADRLARAVKRLAAEKGLRAEIVSSAPAAPKGVVMNLRPEIVWSKDSGFFFLRAGMSLDARFAGTSGAFLQYNLDAARTKSGGVQKAHARRDALKRLTPILAEELGPKLPSLRCTLGD